MASRTSITVRASLPSVFEISVEPGFIHFNPDRYSLLSFVEWLSEQFAWLQGVVGHQSTKALVEELESSRHLVEVIEADQAERLESVPRVHPLPLNPHRARPDRADYLLHRAIRNLGASVHGDALRLCVAHACGEVAGMCVVIDDSLLEGKGKKKRRRDFHKAIVGVRKVGLPEEPVVWLEDATADFKIICTLVGRPVEDRTPPGRLEYVVPPLQFTQDVTQTTSANVVRGLVRGLLAERQEAQRVGIITHRHHLSALNKLEPVWQNRIVRMDYYRSGNDRASNRWLKECDLLIVLGTPRVPPSAVREGLIQVGLLDAAAGDGGWGIIKWEGKAKDEALHNVEGRGYKVGESIQVHNLLVRNVLLQAVGRGRGVRPDGIPVIVVSNERLDLPLAGHECPVIKDEVASTFMTLGELTVKNPKSNTLGKMTVTTRDLAEALGHSAETTRRHCNQLTVLGLLARKGDRGGWMLVNKGEDGQEKDDDEVNNR